MRVSLFSIFSVIGALTLSSCMPDQTHQRRVSRELSSGERYDTLFAGLYLGMSEDEYNDLVSGWMKAGKAQLSSDNIRTVLVHSADTLTVRFKAAFLGDPDAESRQLYQLDFSVEHPWDKVVSFFTRKFEAKFIETRPGDTLVDVRGNREITLRRNDQSRHTVRIIDLSVALQ
jgi:hypothetical protein